MKHSNPFRLMLVPLLLLGPYFAMLALQSTSVTPTATIPAVLTQHNDNARTGLNNQETTLITANVRPATFGKLFARPVDGQIYTQPLYVPNVNIANNGVHNGVHNVVFVATQHNTLYAFDADDPVQSAALWSLSLEMGSETSAPSSDFTTYFGGPYSNIMPEVGVTSTPVIDLATNTIYVANVVKLGVDANNRPIHIHRLWAIDIRTGQPKLTPTQIQGTFPGSGAPDYNGTNVFDDVQQLQRSSLALGNGIVYVTFAGYADVWPYHGWIFAYDKNNLQRTAVFNTSPNGSDAGTWQSSMAPAIDSSGSIYITTGNGDSNAEQGLANYGDAVIKLSPSLQVLDWFSPYNRSDISDADEDFGATGVMLPPGTNLALTGSKEGKIYVLDRNNLGRYHAGDDSQIIQSFQAVNGPVVNSTHHVHGSPVYWVSPTKGPLLYVWGEVDFFRSFQMSGPQQVQATPIMTNKTSLGPGMPGAFLSVSSNNSAAGSGIIWANRPFNTDAEEATAAGILEAYDADDFNGKDPIWSSRMNATRDDFGNFGKFTSPTVVNGKVYLATLSNQLVVYGLLAGTVTNPTDNGLKDTPGTLSYALDKAQPGATIYFNLPNGVNTIQFNGQSLPPVKSGVQLIGKCGPDGPAITLNGNGNTSNLVLQGKNVLSGLSIQNFNNSQVQVSGGGNILTCVKVGT